MRIAFLGPAGTYGEQAALRLAALEGIVAPDLQPQVGIRAVVQALAEGRCDAAVVPVENSVEGGVTACLDALWEHPDLTVARALVLPIRHALLGSGPLSGVSEVLSHPQALAQCSGWLAANLPHALQLPTSSNVAGNCTRFLLLRRGERSLEGPLASLAFSLQANRPGALLQALACFAHRELNMSRIESRPSKREMGEYIFFVDLELPVGPEPLQQALAELQPLCEHLAVFGAYPLSPVEDPDTDGSAG